MRNMQIYAVKTCKYLFKNVKYAVFLALFLAIPAPFQQALQQRVRVNSSLLVNTLRSAQFGRNRGLLTPAAPLPARRPRQAHGQPPLADPPPADGKPATAQLPTTQLLNSTAPIALSSRNGMSPAQSAAPAAAPSSDPALTAAGIRAAHHSFHPARSCSHAPSSVCSAVILSNFSDHSSSVTGGSAL